ncbi:MAG: translational GTPase TypA [Spirochaetaceae bacterium]|nr:translational GTPase TypA [Spirochaetaceae bacterium]
MHRIENKNIRNIAIIAHVDHGKTTLVDAMFKQSGLFRQNEKTDDRLMDTMDLEKERGITIAAKNCSIEWKGIKINVIDTPGHADFGGEVERALSMVDGAILLVDASEGPLPQTRFVLDKAIKGGIKVLVVINKIDRQDARALEVLDEVYSLLIDLDASEEQMEFEVLYAIGRDGIAQESLDKPGKDLHILMDKILEEVPGPKHKKDEPFQMLVSDLSYSDYLGRLAIGKVINGFTDSRSNMICIQKNGDEVPLKISKLQCYAGLGLKEIEKVEAGEIVVISGIENVHIGDTICTKEQPKVLPRITVDEPTVFMNFSRNSSPLAGTEGKITQPGKIKERLEKESLLNVSIQVEESEDKESFMVKGRGEFQMAIIIETMRREGFELNVGRPQVIFKYNDGVKMEPMEHLYVQCENTFTGIVTEKLSRRKGKLINMTNYDNGRVQIEFLTPARSLIGYRDEFLTDTRGTGLMNSSFAGYEEYKGDFVNRYSGSLVGDRSGSAVPYALFNLEPRGTLFILAGDKVYEGMVIGEHNKEGDLNVNPTKTKKLSNMRSSGKDEAVVLSPILPMTLERSLRFIRDDELVEVTPKSIRIRKKSLSAHARKQMDK